MTLNEHYKLHSRKSLKPYVCLLLLIFLVLCVSIFHTFASYSVTTNAVSGIRFANWSVAINNQQITSETSSLSRDN